MTSAEIVPVNLSHGLPTVIVALPPDVAAEVTSLLATSAPVLEIDGAEAFASADALCSRLRTAEKRVESLREGAAAPIYALWKQVNEVAKAAGKPLLAERQRIQDMLGDWQTKERQRVEAEQRAADARRREQERVAREAQRAEEERARKDAEEASAMLGEPVAAIPVAPAAPAVLPAVPAPPPPRASSIRMVPHHELVIDDLAKVEREFYDLNEARLKKHLMDGKPSAGAHLVTTQRAAGR